LCGEKGVAFPEKELHVFVFEGIGAVFCFPREEYLAQIPFPGPPITGPKKKKKEGTEGEKGGFHPP